MDRMLRRGADGQQFPTLTGGRHTLGSGTVTPGCAGGGVGGVYGPVGVCAGFRGLAVVLRLRDGTRRF
jgi:hypothetical protein